MGGYNSKCKVKLINWYLNSIVLFMCIEYNSKMMFRNVDH